LKEEKQTKMPQFELIRGESTVVNLDIVDFEGISSADFQKKIQESVGNAIGAFSADANRGIDYSLRGAVTSSPQQLTFTMNVSCLSRSQVWDADFTFTFTKSAGDGIAFAFTQGEESRGSTWID
jgi:hypothetical protein